MPVDAQGFARPTVAQVAETIAAKARATVSPGLDFAPDAPLGAFTKIVADVIGDAYDVAQAAYDGADRDKAAGVLLDALGKLTLTPRRGASFTECDCTVGLVAGTKLQAGLHFAALAANAATRATPKEDFTAPSDGSFTVRFRAEIAGPVAIPGGQLTVIATAVNGWTSITNAAALEEGHVVDEDPIYRLRQEADVATAGSGTVAAQTADLQKITGVESVLVLENVEDEPDINGLPGHSTEAVVWDGGSAEDNEIAQAIWNTKGGGLRTYGSESGTAIDANGSEQTVRFSRTDPLPVYLSYTVSPAEGYVGDVAFAAAIAEKANLLYRTGASVIAARLQGLPFELGIGVNDVTAFTLGLTASPVGTANIPVAKREIARFDAGRVVVTSS